MSHIILKENIQMLLEELSHNKGIARGMIVLINSYTKMQNNFIEFSIAEGDSTPEYFSESQNDAFCNELERLRAKKLESDNELEVILSATAAIPNPSLEIEQFPPEPIAPADETA